MEKGLLFAQTCDSTFGEFLIYKGVPEYKFLLFSAHMQIKSAKIFHFSLISISTHYVKDPLLSFQSSAGLFISSLFSFLFSIPLTYTRIHSVYIVYRA